MIDQPDNCVYINMLLVHKFQKQCFSFIIVNMSVFMLHVAYIHQSHKRRIDKVKHYRKASMTEM